MEIKVGEYVRTKDGSITKIKEFYKSGLIYSIVGEDETLYGNPKKVVKYHSPDIIGLIEIGDYVNKKRVTGVDIKKHKVYVEEAYYFKKKDIETIFTHEQMEEMEYKL